MQPRIGIAGPFMVHDEKRINFTARREFFREHIFCVTSEPLVKITHLKLGQVGTSIHSKRHVTICAELDGPHEFMTMTVRVPNSGSEWDDRKYGIARAKEFARGRLLRPVHVPLSSAR